MEGVQVFVHVSTESRGQPGGSIFLKSYLSNIFFLRHGNSAGPQANIIRWNGWPKAKGSTCLYLLRRLAFSVGFRNLNEIPMLVWHFTD